MSSYYIVCGRRDDAIPILLQSFFFSFNATSDVNGGDDDLLKIVNLLSFFTGKYSSAVLYCTVSDGHGLICW